jgi:hypothetical protein
MFLGPCSWMTFVAYKRSKDPLWGEHWFRRLFGLADPSREVAADDAPVSSGEGETMTTAASNSSSTAPLDFELCRETLFARVFARLASKSGAELLTSSMATKAAVAISGDDSTLVGELASYNGPITSAIFVSAVARATEDWTDSEVANKMQGLFGVVALGRETERLIRQLYSVRFMSSAAQASRVAVDDEEIEALVAELGLTGRASALRDDFLCARNSAGSRVVSADDLCSWYAACTRQERGHEEAQAALAEKLVAAAAATTSKSSKGGPTPQTADATVSLRPWVGLGAAAGTVLGVIMVMLGASRRAQ